jgi:hypothetical protein
MIAFTEIVFWGLSVILWLLAAFFFAPWRRGFLEQFSKEFQAQTSADGMRFACMFAALASLSAAAAAICRIIAIY